jgi:hypothetical protein
MPSDASAERLARQLKKLGTLRGLNKRELLKYISEQWSRDNPIVRKRGRAKELIWAACDRIHANQMVKRDAPLAAWYEAVQQDLQQSSLGFSLPIRRRHVREWMTKDINDSEPAAKTLVPFVLEGKGFEHIKHVFVWAYLAREVDQVSRWLRAQGMVLPGEWPHEILPPDIQRRLALRFTSWGKTRLYSEFLSEWLRISAEKVTGSSRR